MAGKAMRALKDGVQERMREMLESGLLGRDSSSSSSYDMWIRDTMWSDYSGSTYTRSNARCLARDYEGIVTERGTGSAYGYTGAYISASVLNDAWAIGVYDIAERVMAVLDIIDGLADYPVYSEEDMSALEGEILAEDWESWGKRDFEHELNRLAGHPDEEIELTEEQAQKAFEAFCEAAEGYGYTATSSEVPKHVEMAVALYAHDGNRPVADGRAPHVWCVCPSATGRIH